MAAKFHGKRRTKEHLDKIEQVHAEHRKKIGAAIEDARGKGKITHAEAMKLRNFHDKHGGSLANAIEHLKGLTRDSKGAVAQKSFSPTLLDKAAGTGRPHKYVKRVPKPGGGFRYVYTEPAAPKGEKRERPSGKLSAFEERAGFRVAQPLGWAIKEHGLTAAEGKALMQRFSQHMPHFKMTSDPEKNRAWAATIFNHWAEGAKTGKDKFQRSVNQTANAEIGRLKGKKPEDYQKVADVYKKEAEHRTKKEDKAWHKEVARIIEARGQAAKPSMFEDIPYRELSQMIARPKNQETKKAFTEENEMRDELSLSEREGERIADAVHESEDAKVAALVKAAQPPKPAGKASRRGARPAKAAAPKSAEALAVEAAAPHCPDMLVKAVLEVPVHGKTRKKTIPDERLLAIFKAYVRTEYRNASRYDGSTSAQGIYDRVLSSAEYNHFVEAALGLLEKRKTPFSVNYVKACIAEVEDAQKEASKIAPEPTERSSVIASGG